MKLKVTENQIDRVIQLDVVKKNLLGGVGEGGGWWVVGSAPHDK